MYVRQVNSNDLNEVNVDPYPGDSLKLVEWVMRGLLSYFQHVIRDSV